MSDDNGWTEYRKLVMKELETHGACLDDMRQDISAIKTDLALLKAGVYKRAAGVGMASGGGIAAIGGIIMYILQNWK